MEFDNAQFEQAANNTISTLNRLEDSLKLSNGASGIDGIQRSIDDLDVSKVESAVEKINQQFSIMGIAGKRVIEDLTDSMYNFVNKTVSNAWNSTIGQMKSGGWTRASNIASAKFMLEGIGVAWDDVRESINYAVQDTAYGLDEAAKACSQFAVSGVQLGQDMSDSLRAVSGVAAMTNSEYSDIAQIFTTIAGQGKVMAYQLNQLSFRGLNAAAILAEQMETTEAEVRKMVHNGEISFNDFATAMDNAFGEHAKDANKTFSGAMANIKASMNKIGEVFAAPYIENMVPLLNDVRLFFNAVKQVILGPAEEINSIVGNLIEMASGVVQGGREFLFRFLSDDQLKALNLSEEKIAEIRAQFEKPIEIPFIGALEKAAEIVKEIHDAFLGIQKDTSIFGVTSLFNSNADYESLTSSMGSMFATGGITIDNTGYATQLDLLQELTDQGYSFWQIESLIAEKLGDNTVKFEEMSDAELKAEGYTWAQIQALRELQTVSGYDYFSKVVEGVATVEDLTKAVDDLTDRKVSLKEVSGIPEETRKGFQSLVDQIRAFNDAGFGQSINDILSGAMDNLFGNVEMNSSRITVWTDSLKEQFKDELSYWDIEPSIDQITSLFGLGNYGASGFSEGIDIVFTPTLEDGTTLDAGTLNDYISELIESATVGGVTDLSLLDYLDEEGRMVGGTYVQGIIAAIQDASVDGIDLVNLAKQLSLGGSIWQGANKLGITADAEESAEKLEEGLFKNEVTGETFYKGLHKFGAMVEDTLGETVSNIVGIEKTQREGVKMLDELDEQYMDAINNAEKLEASHKFLSERNRAMAEDGYEVTDEMLRQAAESKRNLDEANEKVTDIENKMEEIMKTYNLTDEIINDIKTNDNGELSLEFNKFFNDLPFMKAPESRFTNIKNSVLSIKDDMLGMQAVIRDMAKETSQKPEFFTDWLKLTASQYQVGVEYSQNALDNLIKQRDQLQKDLDESNGISSWLTKDQQDGLRDQIDANNKLIDLFTESLGKATEARDKFFSNNGYNAETFRGYTAEQLQSFGLTPYGIDAEAMLAYYESIEKNQDMQKQELATLKDRLEEKYDKELENRIAERTMLVNIAEQNVNAAQQDYDTYKEWQAQVKKQEQKENQRNNILKQIQGVNQNMENTAYRKYLNEQKKIATEGQRTEKEKAQGYAQAQKEPWNQNYATGYGDATHRYDVYGEQLKNIENELTAFDENLQAIGNQEKLDSLYAQLDALSADEAVDNTLSGLATNLSNMKKIYNDANALLRGTSSEVSEEKRKELEEETKRLQQAISFAEEIMPELSSYIDEFQITRSNLGIPLLSENMGFEDIAKEIEKTEEEYNELLEEYNALNGKTGKTSADKKNLEIMAADLENLEEKLHDLYMSQTQATSIVSEMSEPFKELFSKAMLNNGEDLAEFLKVLLSQLSIGSVTAQEDLAKVNSEIDELTKKRESYMTGEVATLDEQIKQLEGYRNYSDLSDNDRAQIDSQLEDLKRRRDELAGFDLTSVDNQLFTLNLKKTELENTVTDTQTLIAAYNDAWKGLTGSEQGPELYSQEQLDEKGYTNKDFASAMEYLNMQQEIFDAFDGNEYSTESVAKFMSVMAAQLKRRIHVLQDRKKVAEETTEKIKQLEEDEKKYGDVNSEDYDEEKLAETQKELKKAKKELKKSLGRYKSIEELDKALDEATKGRANLAKQVHSLGFKLYNFTDEELEAIGYSSKGKVDADNKKYLKGLDDVRLQLAKHSEASKELRKMIKEANNPTKGQAMTLRELYASLDPGDTSISGITKLIAGFQNLGEAIRTFKDNFVKAITEGPVGKALNENFGRIGALLSGFGDLLSETNFKKLEKPFSGLANFVGMVIDAIGKLIIILGTAAIVIGGTVFGAIGNLLSRFSDWISKEENINMITEISNAIFDKLSAAVEKVGEMFGWARDRVAEFWEMVKNSAPGQAVGGVLGDTLDGLTQLLTGKRKRYIDYDENNNEIQLDEPMPETNEFLKLYDSVTGKIKEFFGLTDDWQLLTFMDQNMAPLGNKILHFFDDLKRKVQELWAAFTHDHPNIITDLWNAISTYGGKVIKFFTDFFDTFTKSEGFEVIKKTFEDLKNTILDFFGSLGGLGFGGIFDFIFGKKKSKEELISEKFADLYKQYPGVPTSVLAELAKQEVELESQEKSFGEVLAESLSNAVVAVQEKLQFLKDKFTEFTTWFSGTSVGKTLSDFFSTTFAYDETKSIFENIGTWFETLKSKFDEFIDPIKNAYINFKEIFHYDETKTMFENIVEWFNRMCLVIEEKLYGLKNKVGEFFGFGKSKYTDSSAKEYADLADQNMQSYYHAAQRGDVDSANYYLNLAQGAQEVADKLQKQADEAKQTIEESGKTGNGPGGILGMLSNIFGFGEASGKEEATIGAEATELLDGSETAVDKIVNFLHNLGENIGQLGGGVLGMFTSIIGGLISQIADFLQGKDLEAIIKAVKGGVITYAIYSIAKLVSQLGSIFFWFKANQMTKLNPFSINNITRMTVALGAFVAMLYLLRKVKLEDMLSGAVNMLPALAEIIGFFYILGRIEKSSQLSELIKSFRAIGDLIVGVAIGLLLMLGVVKIYKKFAADGDVWAVFGLLIAPLATIVLLSGLVHGLSLAPDLEAIGKALEGLSKYLQALPGFTAFMLLIGWLISVNDGFKDAAKYAAAVIAVLTVLSVVALIVASKFGLLGSAVEDSGEQLSWWQKIVKTVGTALTGLAKSLSFILKCAGVVAVIFSVAAAIAIIGSYGDGALKAAAAIAIVVGAMSLLAFVLSKASFGVFEFVFGCLAVGSAAIAVAIAIALIADAAVMLRNAFTGAKDDTKSNVDAITDELKKGSDQTKQTFEQTGDDIVTSVERVNTFTGKAYNGMFDRIETHAATRNPMGEFNDNIINNTEDLSGYITDETFGGIPSNVSAMSDSVNGEFDNMFGNVETTAGDTSYNINDMFSNVSGEFQNYMSGVIGEVGNLFSMDGTMGAATGGLSSLSGLLNGASGDYGNFVQTLLGGGGSILSVLGLSDDSIIGQVVKALTGEGGLTNAMQTTEGQTFSFADKLRELANENFETGEKGPLWWAKSFIATLLGDNNDGGGHGLMAALTTIPECFQTFVKSIDTAKMPEGPLKWGAEFIQSIAGSGGEEGSEEGGVGGAVGFFQKKFEDFHKFISELELPEGVTNYFNGIIEGFNENGIAGAIGKLIPSFEGLGSVIESLPFPEGVKKFFEEVVTAYNDKGVVGVIDLVKEKISGLPGFIEGQKDFLEDAIKKFFGIDEDTTLVEAIVDKAKELGGGFASGIIDEIKRKFEETDLGKFITDNIIGSPDDRAISQMKHYMEEHPDLSQGEYMMHASLVKTTSGLGLVSTGTEFDEWLAEAISDKPESLINEATVTDATNTAYDNVKTNVETYINNNPIDMSPATEEDPFAEWERQQIANIEAFGPEYKGAGSDHAKSLTDGINEYANSPEGEKAASDAGEKVADGVNKGATDVWDSHSPSKVWYGYAKNLVDGLINGIIALESTIMAGGTTIADDINIAFRKEFHSFEEGSQMLINTITGVITESDLTPYGNEMASEINRGVDNETTVDNMRIAGVDLVNGIIKGVKGGEEALKLTGNWAADTINKGFTEKQQIHSPSKVWAEFGHFMTGALVTSVESDRHDLENASLQISEPFENAMYVMRDMAEGGYSFSPTIAPTVDLSDFRGRTSEIDNMFATRSIGLASLSSDLQASNIEEMARIKDNAIYNDHNVINEIAMLRGDVTNLNSAIQNMKIYLDTGALAGGLSSRIDRRLGQNKMRSSRGV